MMIRNENKINPDDKALLLLNKLRKVVLSQATDEGLWFEACTASEEYLQNALRYLHCVIEEDWDGAVFYGDYHHEEKEEEDNG